MKPVHKHPDQVWRAYLIAHAQLEQHQLSTPINSIRAQRKCIRVVITKVKP